MVAKVMHTPLDAHRLAGAASDVPRIGPCGTDIRPSRILVVVDVPLMPQPSPLTETDGTRACALVDEGDGLRPSSTSGSRKNPYIYG